MTLRNQKPALKGAVSPKRKVKQMETEIERLTTSLSSSLAYAAPELFKAHIERAIRAAMTRGASIERGDFE